jgi:hypothetical protein
VDVLVAQITVRNTVHKQVHKAELVTRGLGQVAQLRLTETLMALLLAMLVTVRAVHLVDVVHLVDAQVVRVAAVGITSAKIGEPQPFTM